MKRFFLFICVLFVGLLASCNRHSNKIDDNQLADTATVKSIKQDSIAQIEGNLLERLLGKHGTLTIVDATKVGVAAFGKKSTAYGFTDQENAVTVECIVGRTYENDSLRIRGLRIGVGTLVTWEKQKDSPTYSIPKAFLNFTEIPDLLRNIDSIAALSKRWQGTVRENSKVTYKTSNNLEVHLDQTGGDQEIYFWIESIKPYRATLREADDLAVVRALIAKGYERLITL